MVKYIVFPALLLIITLQLSAQKTADVGVMGGVTYYIGDLNPGKPFLMPKPAFGMLYRYNFNDRVALRVHGLMGKVAADDAVSKADITRNLNFYSSITELTALLEVNFFEYFIGSKKHRWSPFLFGGASGFLFNPYGNVGGGDVELQPLGTEGQGTTQFPEREPYKKYAFSVPFGLGVKFSINKLMGVSAEWGMHKTTTDYLDDVSTTYYLPLAGTVTNPTVAELASDPTLSHTTGMQRGNSKNTDWYSFAGISLVVKIRMLGKEKCLNHQREGY